MDKDQELILRVRSRLRALGFEREAALSATVSNFLFGGGPPNGTDELESALAACGYVRNGDGYHANLFFWTAVGVSADDYEYMIDEDRDS